MTPPTGRPRDASIDVKVIGCALDMLNECGLGGMSVEGIAARAGVSKASIYRRWDSKDELVVDAVASLIEETDLPDTGDIRTDLRATVAGMRGFVCDSRAGEVLPWMAGEIARQSAVGRRYRTSVVEAKRTKVAHLVSRAVERGELRSDLDVDTAVDMILGPVIMRRLIGSLDGTPESWTDDFVDALLHGWGT